MNSIQKHEGGRWLAAPREKLGRGVGSGPVLGPPCQRGRAPDPRAGHLPPLLAGNGSLGPLCWGETVRERQREREGEEDRERIGGTESQLLYWPLANMAASVVKNQTGLRSRVFVV